jgi:hypothetical protein
MGTFLTIYVKPKKMGIKTSKKIHCNVFSLDLMIIVMKIIWNAINNYCHDMNDYNHDFN